MSDRESANLLFHPVHSTAEHISNVSGRGVGMDVVKNNIEKIGENRGRFFRSRFGYNCAHEDSVDAGDYSALLTTSTRNR
jgi:two-component system chemotaxis sensor kinase CheA